MRTTLSLMAVITSLLTGPALAAPTLLVTPERHDFGTVLEGAPAETVFTLSNRGDTLLSVSRVRTSCGCTASALMKDELMPGESTTLTVSYETKGRPGEFTKTVTIFSDDPAGPERVVTVSGVVKGFPRPNATFAPNPIRLDRVPVGEERKISVTLTNSGDAALLVDRITLLDMNRRPLRQLLPGEPLRLAPGRSAPIMVAVSPKNAAPFRYFVEVSTNNPLHPLAYVTLFGEGVSRQPSARTGGAPDGKTKRPPAP
ncbi:MAG: DUF1573 domain-containing protein [Nitrospinae bacterium]|nr:DUF1573 domain-containing protein [Nitrospinota bacterium]